MIRKLGPGLEPALVPDRDGQQTTDSTVRNFSIVVGGPVYDFLLRLGVVRFGLPNVFRRIVALIAITWLPLLLLSLNAGLAFGHEVRIPFLYDFSMYGRFLLGLPLLILAEEVIDPSIRRTVAEFIEARIVQEKDVAEFDAVLQKTQRLRNSAIPEITLLVLAFFPVFLFQHEWTAGSVESGGGKNRGLVPRPALPSMSFCPTVTYCAPSGKASNAEPAKPLPALMIISRREI